MKKIPTFVPPLLIAITVGVFIYFFVSHPVIRHTLTRTSPQTILLLLALYGLFILCLVWVYDVTLRMCNRRLKPTENILLTCYSTISNFFGPLQSGPGVRAAYLKRKYQVKLRDYTVATLLYYALYAIISAIFLLGGSGHYWYIGVALVLAVAAGSIGIVIFMRRRMQRKELNSELRITPALIAQMSIATFCQLAVQSIIFYVELHAIHAGADLRHAFVYGGAANFALFVSLTPGAIGFRETFLEFSHRLHHISTNDVLSANIIDRSVFVVFLGILFLIILVMHANRRFGSSSSHESATTAE